MHWHFLLAGNAAVFSQDDIQDAIKAFCLALAPE
jgi:hypothetical protein